MTSGGPDPVVQVRSLSPSSISITTALHSSALLNDDREELTGPYAYGREAFPAMTITPGLHVPMLTPFDATGEVAFAALERLAHEVLDGGAAGLVALGTTGEPSALTAGERDRVRDLLAGVCRDHRAFLAVGAHDGITKGAAAVLTLVPPFVRPGEDGVVA